MGDGSSGGDWPAAVSERRGRLRRREDVEARRGFVPRTRTWFVIIGTCIGLGLYGTLFVAAWQRQQGLDRAHLASCDESNIPHAYIQLVLDRIDFDYGRLGLPAPSEALPILDCGETVEQDRNIRLSKGQERLYLRVFADGQLPVVEDGRVLGGEPFPSPAKSSP